jgi:hypothetical protein
MKRHLMEETAFGLRNWHVWLLDVVLAVVLVAVVLVTP